MLVPDSVLANTRKGLQRTAVSDEPAVRPSFLSLVSVLSSWSAWYSLKVFGRALQAAEWSIQLPSMFACHSLQSATYPST